MPRRPRPAIATRSEHWLRVAVNKCPRLLNEVIANAFEWQEFEEVDWVSPLESDEYAEYYDVEFLDRLQISNPKVPLIDFWPQSGPRWDALGKTDSGKLILVEAKAYIEEGVDFKSKASAESLAKINSSLAQAKAAFGAQDDAPWTSPFYQYANRLAHLYYLRRLNGLDAYLVFLYFSDAPDVPRPSTAEQWQGAARLTEKCLGLAKNHPFRKFVVSSVVSVNELTGG